MSTVHINANINDFADTVLMPGDPKRAKYIADNFLQDVKEVCNVRSMTGYTGSFNGKKVSIMGSGMGCPSIGIYAWELINHFKVKNIIRVGTAGGFSNAKLGDVILLNSASTDSSVLKDDWGKMHLSAAPSFELLHHAFNTAKQLNIDVSVGGGFSADEFYDAHLEKHVKILESYGILCIEMEAAMLYKLGMQYGVNTLAIVTISDMIFDSKSVLTSEERETSLNDMCLMGLTTAFNVSKN